MDPDDRAVDHDVFEVGVLGQPIEKTLPCALPGPSPEARVNAVPLAELVGQVAPRRSGTRDPQNRFDKKPIVLSAPTRVTDLARQIRGDPCPLFIAQDFPNQRSSPQFSALNRKSGQK